MAGRYEVRGGEELLERSTPPSQVLQKVVEITLRNKCSVKRVIVLTYSQGSSIHPAEIVVYRSAQS